VDSREHVLGLEEARRSPEPIVHPLCLFGHLARLHEHPGGAGWQEFGEVRMPGVGRRRQGRKIGGLNSGYASLGDGVKRAERLDLVAEEFDADRPIPVRREQVDDPAAAGEGAGGVDGVNESPTANAEPVGEFLRVEVAADGESPGARRDLARVGKGRQQRLDARHHQRRADAVSGGERPDDGQPLGLRRVGVGRTLVAEALDMNATAVLVAGGEAARQAGQAVATRLGLPLAIDGDPAFPDN
jgi:hypothetical protein